MSTPVRPDRNIDGFDTTSILPEPPDGAEPILHDREYRVRAYRLADDRILLLGAVRDQKPPGLYIPGDPDPLTVHHMQLGLEIAFPSLEILEVRTSFETHPEASCPDIIPRYRELVGLSIARGFTHKVRELLGGPRGCTHTTALLQAMAPIAMQCFWSMRAAKANDEGADTVFADPSARKTDTNWRLSINTCHVWDEHGPAVARREQGEVGEIPLFIRPRLRSLGLLDDADRPVGAGVVADGSTDSDATATTTETTAEEAS